MNEPRIAFETTADAASFPGTLATVNSVLHFHRGASVCVTCDEAELADAHWRLLASCNRVVAAVGAAVGQRFSDVNIARSGTIWWVLFP